MPKKVIAAERERRARHRPRAEHALVAQPLEKKKTRRNERKEVVALEGIYELFGREDHPGDALNYTVENFLQF